MRHIALAVVLAMAGMSSPSAADEPQLATALVRVKVLDVDVTAASKLNVQMKVAGDNPAPESPLLKRLLAEISGGPVADDGLTQTIFLTADDPGHGVINALRKEQLATVIAEPNILSAFGQPARFNSGGEFPVPKDAAANSVEMKQYGTRVETLVKERGADRAVVEVAVHLSEIDEKRSVKSGNFVIPALRVFEVSTGFEGKWGETFVLCSKRPDQKKGLGAPHKIMRMILVTPERIAPLGSTVAAKPTAPAQ